MLRPSDERCTTVTRQSILKLRENRSEVRFENPARIDLHHTQIDGCLMTDADGMRCDHLVAWSGHTALVELKGTDVAHALKQLAASHAALKPHEAHVVWIVATRRCPLTSTRIQAEQRKLRKRGVRLVIGNSPVTHPVAPRGSSRR